MTTQPNVSVIVATYNSSDFVIETLESIKSQTYPSIELIISDDASSDTTVALCRTWLDQHKNRFVKTTLLTVPVNTGVSANCNRSMAATGSQWIKFIAGDDVLLPTCIEDNMSFVQDKPQIQILFSKVKVYKNTFETTNFIRVVPDQYPNNVMHPDMSASDQFKKLLLSDRISYTPSFFFKKEAVLAVGGYDEANTAVEDYPMWLKLTRAGIRLDFMEKVTVGYRQHNKALNNIETNVLFKPMELRTFSFRKKYVHPLLPWDIAYAERWQMGVKKLVHLAGMNIQNTISQGLYRFLTVYANPFQYVISFRKKFLKAARTNTFYAN
ncbi:MAG: glycosyltransferase [Cyclobacteriaceae bacterium]|nr:glycosyltransferase [Cyclobacteriaceae bacterium]